MTRINTLLTRLLLAAVIAPTAHAADLQLSIEPARVEFPEDQFAGARDDRHGFEVSGTWAFGPTLDVRMSWHDAQTLPRAVVSSPFWADYATRGYSVAFNQQAFGPFEVFGRFDVMDIDVRTANINLPLTESRRITIAGAGARWRPTSDTWGFEAGANRATDRPTFVGVGVFISF
ncbi:MAG: hypothetical protein WD081_09770 [Gammaproteobacteria bacterium]